jgi:hypothetical protein
VLVVALTVAVNKVYLRLLKNAHSFRAATGAPAEGPLHGVCFALHSLGAAYLLAHWAVCKGEAAESLVKLQQALQVLGADAPWVQFLLAAAAGVDWCLMLPRIVLALNGVSIALSFGALIEARCRGLWAGRSGQHQGVTLGLLLHVYFSAASVVALYLGPVGGALLFSWVVTSILYVQSYQQMLIVSRATFTYTEQERAAATEVATARPVGEVLRGARSKRLLFVVLLAIYFPLAARWLFYITGHRTDFGTLQVL